MANRLKMAQQQSIMALARLGWSYRRIAAEVGVDRETVSRLVRASRADPPDAAPGGPLANAAIPITGSAPANGAIPGSNAAILIPGSGGPPAGTPAGQRSRCEPLREIILGKLEQGLTARRIWQDLRDEHAFADGYQCVQRFVKRLGGAGIPLPFRRMECAPGAEAQVDFGRGAPVVRPDGKRTRPHLFRIVLSCSRKAYSEVVARQTTEEFLRSLENAFRHFGGVPRTLVPDNLKAAVITPDWFDPELNPKILAFCEHYGTVCLPTRPRTPRHKGKVERGVGYAQSNALKGRTFTSLAEQNAFLARWEESVADTRIHGTTRRQVGPFFAEVEKAALLPLPEERFPFFHEAQRIVNRDGHVEVARAYYSVPPEFLGRTVWARWDGRVVRIYDERLAQIAIHAQSEPGRFATDDRHIAKEKRGGVERGAAWWLRRADTVGSDVGRWAQAVLTQRGVHALRVVMGLVGLTQRHKDADVDRACRVAHGHGAWRLRDIRNLLKRQDPPEQERFDFIQEHPLIRSLSDYGRLVHDAFEEVHA
jgi:transposase